MDIDRIAKRVAGARVAGVPELRQAVLGYESMADMLEDLVAAVGEAFAAANSDGQLGPEVLALMAEEHDVIASAVESVLPKVRELDEKILAAP